jgi:hypothetical protein
MTKTLRNLMRIETIKRELRGLGWAKRTADAKMGELVEELAELEAQAQAKVSLQPFPALDPRVPGAPQERQPSR